MRDREYPNCYAYEATETAWEAWQAALKAKRQARKR